AGYQDCYIDTDDLTNTQCKQQEILAGFDGSATQRSLLQFDLSGIPSDSVIQNAELGIDLDGQSSGNSSPMGIYPVTTAWNSQATWQSSDGTQPWGTPGGDFSATPAAVNPSVGSGGTGWYHWWPTQLVQGWVNGSATNRGVLLKETSENINDVFHFYSGEDASSSNWPYLTVKWDTPTGLQPWYPFYDLQLTDTMDLHVNLATGNLVLHNNDFAMPGIGLPLSEDRYYNNRSYYGYADGNGWNRVLGNEVGLYLFNDGSAEFFGPTGEATPLIHNPDGTFQPPPGIDAQLVHNQDGTYTLTLNQSGVKYTMFANGYLRSIQDRSGNQLTQDFSGSTVSQVTDTQGRV
ncbi:MAG: DNRLRE domain-containing protein, partial [Acidimicrobiales bacterium]